MYFSSYLHQNYKKSKSIYSCCCLLPISSANFWLHNEILDAGRAWTHRSKEWLLKKIKFYFGYKLPLEVGYQLVWSRLVFCFTVSKDSSPTTFELVIGQTYNGKKFWSSVYYYCYLHECFLNDDLSGTKPNLARRSWIKYSTLKFLRKYLPFIF